MSRGGCHAAGSAGYFNARYQRTGTLWEGRFHSTTIGSEFYLLGCHRYIDNNPVRAGMVDRPDQYLWSSHRHYTSDDLDPIVTPHESVIGLAGDIHARRRAYRALFETAEDPDQVEALRAALRTGCALMNTSPFSIQRKKVGRPPKKTRT